MIYKERSSGNWSLFICSFSGSRQTSVKSSRIVFFAASLSIPSRSHILNNHGTSKSCWYGRSSTDGYGCHNQSWYSSLALLLRKRNYPAMFHLDGAGRLSATAAKKRGRGRPPKSASSSKAPVSTDKAKRGRGRPPKSTGAATKKAPVASAKRAVSPPKDDGNKKKRGRPSKSNPPNERVKEISKPAVSHSMVLEYRIQISWHLSRRQQLR